MIPNNSLDDEFKNRLSINSSNQNTNNKDNDSSMMSDSSTPHKAHNLGL